MNPTLKKILIGKFTIWRILTSLILVPVLIYIGLGLYAYNYSERIIFQPRVPSYRDDDSILKLTTPGGDKISAKYFNKPDAKYTILFSHGNGEDIGGLNDLAKAFNDAGFSFFAYDYHGYGTSDSKPSIEKAYDSIDTSYNYLVRTLKIPADRIIVHGRSLGGAISVDVATRKSCAGVIIESSFVTAFRVMTVVTIYPFDNLRNVDKVSQLRCPALIIHGKKDSIIPFWHGEQLFKEAHKPKYSLWLDNADHNNVYASAPAQYIQSIRDFSATLSK